MDLIMEDPVVIYKGKIMVFLESISEYESKFLNGEEVIVLFKTKTGEWGQKKENNYSICYFFNGILHNDFGPAYVNSLAAYGSLDSLNMNNPDSDMAIEWWEHGVFKKAIYDETTYTDEHEYRMTLELPALIFEEDKLL